VTAEQMHRQYVRFNRELFAGSLPERVVMKISRMKDALAETSLYTDQYGALIYYKMEFSRELQSTGRRMMLIVLLHELCHLAAGLHNGHNKVFMANINRLTRNGAFDDLLG